MKNKNLILGFGIAVVVYFIYNQNQKKKLQATPYSDAELDKVISDYVSKELINAKLVSPNIKVNPEMESRAKQELLSMIKKASANGKDVSRGNIDKILVIYSKWSRNMSGDTKSLGTITPEEFKELSSFQCRVQPTKAEEEEGYKKRLECQKKYNIAQPIDTSKMTKEEIINATLENAKNAEKYGALCNSYMAKEHC